MNKPYDFSWYKNEKVESWDRKYKEWTKRNWENWLKENLSFPFTAERIDDEDDAYFTNIAEKEPFRLGHTMKVLNIEMEDDLYGIIVKVREKGRVGAVPLVDLEIASEQDKNYWPVMEYSVWFANCRD